MKNIKQLKKEIERKNKKHRKEAGRLNIEPLSDGGWQDTIEPEAKLQTLREVCDEVKGLREIFSDLEHEQWISWSKYVAENNEIPKELLKKWEKNWKPYSKLNEKTKDSDRIWADKIIDELLKKFQGEKENANRTIPKETTY